MLKPLIPLFFKFRPYFVENLAYVFIKIMYFDPVLKTQTTSLLKSPKRNLNLLG